MSGDKKEKRQDEQAYEDMDPYLLIENLERCMQCGKCVGACPVAGLSPSYNARQIISDVVDGRHERWSRSEEIWRCFLCAGCHTLCPVDINFPALIMQLRYLALERKYGVRYVVPFKRFAIAARRDGLTFLPASEKARDRIKKIRTGIGLEPWPEISEKAREEYQALFDLTGASASIEAINEEDDKPLDLRYAEGKVGITRRKDD